MPQKREEKEKKKKLVKYARPQKGMNGNNKINGRTQYFSLVLPT